MTDKNDDAKWVEVDPSELMKTVRTEFRGVDVRVTVSPYDVPDAVRGYYDARKSRFVIEFKYLSEEPYRTKVINKNLGLRVGQSSQRLLGIEIAVDDLKASAVALTIERVEDAIESLAESPLSGRRKDNYRIAGKVIANQQHEIFSAVTSVE